MQETCMTEILIALATNILSPDYSSMMVLLQWFNFIYPQSFLVIRCIRKFTTHANGRKPVCMKLSLSFFLSDCLKINAIFLQIK